MQLELIAPSVFVDADDFLELLVAEVQTRPVQFAISWRDTEDVRFAGGFAF